MQRRDGRRFIVTHIAAESSGILVDRASSGADALAPRRLVLGRDRRSSATIGCATAPNGARLGAHLSPWQVTVLPALRHCAKRLVPPERFVYGRRPARGVRRRFLETFGSCHDVCLPWAHPGRSRRPRCIRVNSIHGNSAKTKCKMSVSWRRQRNLTRGVGSARETEVPGGDARPRVRKGVERAQKGLVEAQRCLGG
jgi:hypothetical protein